MADVMPQLGLISGLLIGGGVILVCEAVAGFLNDCKKVPCVIALVAGLLVGSLGVAMMIPVVKSLRTKWSEASKEVSP